MLEEYRELSIPIWGEIELAYEFSRGKLVAITGTNGKTTTTTLVGQIMSAFYESVYVVGNIGNPYTDIALDTTDETVTVAEISSFQLETTQEFQPDVSAILNITPDHLNRHHTMECYVKTKERIAARQTKEDICILNYEDAYTRDFGSRCPGKVIYFSNQFSGDLSDINFSVDVSGVKKLKISFKGSSTVKYFVVYPMLIVKK